MQPAHYGHAVQQSLNFARIGALKIFFYDRFKVLCGRKGTERHEARARHLYRHF
jgi:hypothetical protein